MSYNIPGQNSGFVRTEAPSPPCTGNFVERLDCSDYGVFFWVGAVCVIVVVCGLFSCYIVSPLLEWWKERTREYIEYRNKSRHPSASPPNRHHHHDSLDKTRPEANAENPPRRAPNKAKTPRKHRRPDKVHGMNSHEETKLEEASGAFTPTVRTKRQRSARSSRDLKASMGSNRGAERSSHERRGSQT